MSPFHVCWEGQPNTVATRDHAERLGAQPELSLDVWRHGGAAGEAYAGRLLHPLAIFVLFVSVVKGVAFPHHWAATHLFFDYQYGFVKRGLVGAFARAIGAHFLQDYRFFFYVTLAIVLANLVLIVSGFAEVHRRAHGWLRLGPLVYASSIGAAYLANSIGYADHLGLLATLLALRIEHFWKRLGFIALTFSVLLFVHEAIFVAFLPVALVTFIFDPRIGSDKKRLFSIGVVVAALACITYVIAGAVISKAASVEMYRAAQARADFLLFPEAFDVLYRTGVDNFRIMARAWGRERYWADAFYGAVTTLPTAALLLFFAWKAMRSAGVGRSSAMLVLAAGVSPLCLHVVAWDIHRWNALAITTSFVTLHAITRHTARPRETLFMARPLLIVVAVLLVLNMSATTWFLNGRQVRAFPWRDHVDYWRHLAMGREEFPARPLEPKRLTKLSKISPYAKWLRFRGRAYRGEPARGR